MKLDRLRVHARRHSVDALVLAFALASLIEVFLSRHVDRPLLYAPLALGWSLPFLARPRRPFSAPLLVVADLAVLSLVGDIATALTLPFLALLGCAIAFGTLADSRLRIAGWAALVGVMALADFRSGNEPSDFFWTALILTLAWFFGVALGTRTEQARELRERVRAVERARSEEIERAAATERARIARELHDVVAHSISVMVVQASGVRRLLREEQAREREALLSVEQIGRQALSEMRRMLGVMTTGTHEPAAALSPQPGLEHLERLIAQVEQEGLPVTLHVEGTRGVLSPGVDLSAYRIVQEGLTNALKHAKGAHAEVTVRYAGDAVELEVADDGPGLAAANGGGHGLVGMRERVALYGGTLEAGPRPGGGFALRARLPMEGARA